MNSIPEPITVIDLPSGGDRVSRTIDDFFDDVRREVENRYPDYPHEFQIIFGNMGYARREFGVGDKEKVVLRESEDNLTYLRCGDQILAMVLMTRTDSNWLRYTFFRVPKINIERYFPRDESVD